MQAILNVTLQEIDQKFLAILRDLLSQNIEVVIKKETPRLEEFDHVFGQAQADIGFGARRHHLGVARRKIRHFRRCLDSMPPNSFHSTNLAIIDMI